MTSQNISSLSSVKEQVEKMINTIHNLSSDEKNEAFGYIRKCIDSNNTKLNSNEDEKPNRAIRKKIKFKSHTTVKRTVLKCRICGIPTETKSTLLKHLRTHIGTPISCKTCKREFNNRASFNCHISLKMCQKSRKVVQKYYCNQCPKVFRYKRQHDKHMEGHKRNNCTYCDARITKQKELEDHLLTIHSIKLERTVMFKCEYCEKRYVKKRSLYHHMKQHAENKIVCMECGWLSETAEDHDAHFKEHEKNRPWKCNKCNDRFLRRQQYESHMERHDRYKCVTCNETFASKSHVLRHKQNGHTVQGLEPQNKCPHCPIAFQRRLNLQIHMKKKHSDEKLMSCKYCDKNFRSPYLYFKHIASTAHEINYPVTINKQFFVCKLCEKSFVKRCHLDQHLHRVHQSKQLHTCKYCGFKSSNRPNLERHLALHLENKKEVMCEQCGQAFYNQSSLKDHISYVHSQQRSLKCSQCEKKFKRNSELVRHMTSHSEVRPHVCQTCGVSYKRRNHLRRHEESSHGTVLQNRRVQRLTTDENGHLVPIPQEKKTNKKKIDLDTNQQLISVITAQSGDYLTFSISDSDKNQQLQTVELQNFVLNPVLTNEQSLNLINIDQNFSNQFLNSDSQISNALPIQILNQPVALQNSTTCDVLLPENRILNIQTQAEQNDYSYFIQQ